MAIIKGQKTKCIYCGGQSDFTVLLRNENEQIVGALYYCEDHRHMIEKMTADVWIGGKKMIKTHITNVPPQILIEN